MTTLPLFLFLIEVEPVNDGTVTVTNDSIVQNDGTVANIGETTGIEAQNELEGSVQTLQTIENQEV